VSYILSALKKAEESRGGQPGAPLSPVAVPAPGPARDDRRGPSLRGWLAGLAVVALVVAGVLWRPSLEFPARPGDGATAPRAAEVEAVEQPVAATPEPVTAVTTSPAPPAPAPIPPATNPIPPPPSAPPPPLAITGYIYFDGNPAASKLFVDGVVHRQGSSPGPGMVIRDFRPDRVIIAYRGALHEVPVP